MYVNQLYLITMNIIRYAKCFTDVSGPEVFKQCANSWISNRKKMVGGKCEKEFSPPSSNDQICNAYHERVDQISKNWLFGDGKWNISKMAHPLVPNLFLPLLRQGPLLHGWVLAVQDPVLPPSEDHPSHGAYDPLSVAREVVQRSFSCHIPDLAREVIGDRAQPGLGVGGPGHLYHTLEVACEHNGGGD